MIDGQYILVFLGGPLGGETMSVSPRECIKPFRVPYTVPLSARYTGTLPFPESMPCHVAEYDYEGQDRAGQFRMRWRNPIPELERQNRELHASLGRIADEARRVRHL